MPELKLSELSYLRIRTNNGQDAMYALGALRNENKELLPRNSSSLNRYTMIRESPALGWCSSQGTCQ